MALSSITYTGTGAQKDFTFNKPYLSASHVKATVNGVATAITVSGATVSFGTAPAAGSTVRIYRETPTTPLITFSDGTTDTADVKNIEAKQSLYIAQETLDEVDQKIGKDNGYWDAQGLVIKNAGAAMDNTDVLTRATGQTILDAATAQAASAAGSASAATAAQTLTESARDAALLAYDSFDDRYLGAKSSTPTLDNDGNPLLTGALYFDTTTSAMKIYTGSAWVAAYVAGTDYFIKSNNLSDVLDAAAARNSLGLGTAAVLNAGTAASNLVKLDASAKLPAVDGSQLTGISTVGTGYCSNLTIKNTNGNSDIGLDITCEYAVLLDPNNKAVVHRNIALSMLTTYSWASNMSGGHDGDLPYTYVSTWYYVWLISNGTTVSSLFSRSSTSPNMPSGYTYKLRVAEIRVNGTGYNMQMYRRGNITHYGPGGYGILSSGATGSTATPTYTTVSLAAAIPPTAIASILHCVVPDAAGALIASEKNIWNYGALNANSNQQAPINMALASGATTLSHNLEYVIPNLDNNLYVAAAGAGTKIFMKGFIS